MGGPLQRIRIIEFAGIGPAPFCAMMLADHGAEVIRIDRIGAKLPPEDPLLRSRKSIAIDLKSPKGIEIAKALTGTADGVIEGMRPNVMERLGLGPDILLRDNPRLVFGRMTGWGQSGPLSSSAGHDINYIAVSGALHTCGRAGQKPTPPVNYLGDFGGGGMFLAFGMLAALIAVQNGGVGQVIDCAMTDGSALLASATWGLFATGAWEDERGVNLLDTGAHFYDTYETADEKWIAIGAIEKQFYTVLLEKLGLENDPEFAMQMSRDRWPDLKERLTEIFRRKTFGAWCELLEGTESCFAPVLSLAEAPEHSHNMARKTFVKVGDAIQPAPAPRYSSIEMENPRPPLPIGTDTDNLLAELGIANDDVRDLRKNGIIG